MYITVTFKDGTESNIDVSQSHTVQVISPGNQVESAVGLNDVAAIALHDGTAPVADVAAADPTPAAVADDAVTASNADSTAGDVTLGTSTASAATVADPPAPESDQSSPSPSGSTDPEPSSSISSSEQPAASTTDDGHDQAVADAQAAIDTAGDVTDADHVKNALADVETALVQWPDSQPLLDAKAQLEQIASS